MIDGVETAVYSCDVAGQLLSENGAWPNEMVSYTAKNEMKEYYNTRNRHLQAG